MNFCEDFDNGPSLRVFTEGDLYFAGKYGKI